MEQQPYATVTYKNIVSQFVLMGWTAFGGPQAHIALFETVRIRIWRRVRLLSRLAGRARLAVQTGRLLARARHLSGLSTA